MIHAFRVTVYRHGDPAALDVTPFVRSLSWSESIKAPFASVSLSMRDVTVADGASEVIPRPGDWIAVSHDRYGTLAVAVVSSAEFDARTANQGEDRTMGWEVSAGSWLDYYGRIEIVVSALRKRGQDVGTLYSAERWLQIKTGAKVGASRGQLGYVLDQMVPVLFNVRLPSSLGGGKLVDNLTVAHRAEHSTRRVVDPVVGRQLNGLSSLDVQKATAMSMLLGTFVPDDQMVELFPTVEPSGSLSWEDGEGGAPDQALQAGRTRSRGMARACGASLALVYRMKPWRVRPLSQYTRDEVVPTYATATGGTVDLRSDLFQRVTWDLDRAPTVDATQMKIRWEDSEFLNAVTVGLPSQADSPIGLAATQGLPIVADVAVERYGLRMYRPNWPFFEPLTKDNAGDVFRFMRTVAVQAAQFHAGAGRFGRGSFRCAGNPRVRAGEPVKVRVVGAEGQEGLAVNAYVERVEHRVDLDGRGGGSWMTNGTVSRALWAFNEWMRDKPFSLGDGEQRRGSARGRQS